MKTLESQKGQTLVEVVVAIAIIAVAVFGMTQLSRLSLTTSDSAENELVAVNLAREGIELVRGIREGSWASVENMNNLWAELSTDTDPNVYYFINPDLSYDKITVNVGDTLPEQADLKLKTVDESGETYTTSYIHLPRCPGSECLETVYTRAITFDMKNEADIEYLLVTSKVTYTNRGKVREVVLYEKLFDWRY